MRKRIKPVVLLVFFIGIISFLVLSRTIADLQARERQETTKTIPNSNTPRKTTTASSSSKKEEDINPELVGRPIIDISGWQLPSEIDYDVLSQNVGGVIVRVHSGAQAKKENAATYLNGLDKSFKTHIQEFQKRNIPVAVYAYVAAKDKKEMEEAANELLKSADDKTKEEVKKKGIWDDFLTALSGNIITIVIIIVLAVALAIVVWKGKALGVEDDSSDSGVEDTHNK